MSTGEHMSLCAKHNRLFGKCCECLRERCDELEAKVAELEQEVASYDVPPWEQT